MEVALGTTGGVPRGASLSAGGGTRMVFIGLVVIRKNFQEMLWSMEGLRLKGKL